MIYRLALVLLWSLCLPACFDRGNSNPSPGSTSGNAQIGPKEGNGVPYGLTRLTYENGRARCGFSLLEAERTYRVVCHAMAVQANGSERLADSIEAGLAIQWLDPKRFSGASLVQSRCETFNSGLSSSCEVTLADTTGTQVQFDLQIRDGERERTSSDVVHLPYSVVTYGQGLGAFSYVPLSVDGVASRTRGRQGLQNPLLPALKYAVVSPRGVCRAKGILYFTAGSLVYKLDALMRVSIAFGSSNPKNQNRLDPYGIYFGLGPLGIACAETATGVVIYVANQGFNRVVKFSEIGPGIVVAGTGSVAGFSGDGGPATLAQLSGPSGVALGPGGAVYVADSGNSRIRKIDSNGIITTVAGTGTAGYSPEEDGHSATAARLNRPLGIAAEADGTLCIADGANGRIRRVDSDGIITTLANGLSEPVGVAFGPGKYCYFADMSGLIRKALVPGEISIVAGTLEAPQSLGDGGPATAAKLFWPQGLVVLDDGTLYISDTLNNRIRKIDSLGIISTIAGSGEIDSGDGGPAVSAQIANPGALAMAPDGTLYIADGMGHRIRKIDPSGVITNYAGTGNGKSSGDGLRADKAEFLFPTSLALGPDGSLYVVDFSMNHIRKIEPGGGIVSTIAGTGVAGFSGDGGDADKAQLNGPAGIAVSPDGVFIADSGNYRVRKIDGLGKISTIAGTGVAGYMTQNNVPATGVMLGSLGGVAVGPDKSVFVTDTYNNRIRKITPDGNITTLQFVARPGESAFIWLPSRIVTLGDEIYFVEGAQKSQEGIRIGVIRRARLKEDGPSPVYWLETFYGVSDALGAAATENNPVDVCAGSVSGTATADSLDKRLQQSLALVCRGTVLSLAASCGCHEPEETESLALGQNLWASSGIVKITRRCRRR